MGSVKEFPEAHKCAIIISQIFSQYRYMHFEGKESPWFFLSDSPKGLWPVEIKS